MLAELILNKLDVASKTQFAVPLEIGLTCFLAINRLFTDEETRRLSFDVQKEELAPVKVQLEWGLIGVDLRKVGWDVSLLDKTSANAITDGSNQILLGWFLGIVDTEDVLALWLRLINFLNHTSQVSHVDCGHQVVTLTDNR